MLVLCRRADAFTIIHHRDTEAQRRKDNRWFSRGLRKKGHFSVTSVSSVVSNCFFLFPLCLCGQPWLTVIERAALEYTACCGIDAKLLAGPARPRDRRYRTSGRLAHSPLARGRRRRGLPDARLGAAV